MMATYTCSRCGIIYEPGPDNMIERTIVRTQRYTSTIAGEDIYWLCPKCREKFIEAANNFVYGNRKENKMTKLDDETAQELKLCLDGNNCIRCPLGDGGKPIFTCRELLEKLAEFAGIEIERSNNDDNLHV